MAETGKGVTAGKLAINVQKRLSRAQEKVEPARPLQRSNQGVGVWGVWVISLS